MIMSSQQSIKRFFSPKQQQKALVNQGMATISPKSGDSTSSPGAVTSSIFLAIFIMVCGRLISEALVDGLELE